MNSENVFKVCDEPHPILIRDMIEKCLRSDFDEAYKAMNHLWRLGYTAEDILSVIMRVTKTYQMSEFIQLEFIRVLKSFLFFFEVFFDLFFRKSVLLICVLVKV